MHNFAVLIIADSTILNKKVKKNFLNVVKESHLAIRRTKSIAAPPIEMLNMDAEKMDIADALKKYKVCFFGASLIYLAV